MYNKIKYMQIEERIQVKTGELQMECHSLVQNIINQSEDKSSIKYQDAFNVWLFMKLAELEIKINDLNNLNGQSYELKEVF